MKTQLAKTRKKFSGIVLGVMGIIGLFSNKALSEDSAYLNQSTDANRNNLETQNSNDESSTIKSVIQYYWGNRKSVTAKELDQLRAKFGEIPSKEVMEKALEQALNNVNSTRGFELDEDGVKRKEM